MNAALRLALTSALPLWRRRSGRGRRRVLALRGESDYANFEDLRTSRREWGLQRSRMPTVTDTLLRGAAKAETNGSASEGSTQADELRQPDFEFGRVMAAARRGLFGASAAMLPSVGRYRIDGRLGAGGMGEVYLGFDPELERYAAVKLVRAEYSHQQGARRLRLEAKALARLAHPNVVGVYEVGEHQGRTFLAMEYVQGQTFEDALAAAEPPLAWTEVLRLFVAAGRGLAAAHAAGIVHRDFKPANVMLTREGRVLVTDFGLALAGVTSADLHSHNSQKTTLERRRRPSERLSVTGTMLGTVRYMPLEQIEAREVDHRADQFAFCVALYEALWAQAPLPDATLGERRDALRAASPVRRPGRGSAPMALWRILVRGLATEPEQRWPSMSELLDALSAVPRHRRWLMTTALVLPALVGVVGLGVWAWPGAEAEPVDPCAMPAEATELAWSPSRRAELERAFRATGLPFAATSARQAAESLDRWWASWSDEREQVCRATVAGSLAAATSGLRGACLERARTESGAVVMVLLAAEAETVTRSQELLASLPSLAGCRDDANLLLGVAVPNEAQREQVEELRRRLAMLDARARAGREDGLLVELDALLAKAEASGYRPVLAEALVSRGDLECSALDLDAGVASYQRAIDLAEATRHDQLLARAWLELAVRGVNDLRDADRAEQWLRRAIASNERLGRDPQAVVQVQIEFVAAKLAGLRGDPATAERALRALIERSALADDPKLRLRLPAYLSHLASVVGDDGARQAEALALREEALEAAVAVFPAGHPEIAGHAHNLGQALLAAGRSAEARVQLELAAKSWLASHRDPHPQLGLALLSMTELELAADELDAAQIHAEAAEQIFARSWAGERQHRGNAAMATAVVANMRGELALALTGYQRAAEHFSAVPGVDVEHDPTIALVDANAGACALELGDYERARELFELAASRAGPGPHAVIARLGLAGLALRALELASAAEHLRVLASLSDTLDEGDRLEVELLSATLKMRRDGLAPATTADLRAAFKDPMDLHHRRLAIVGRSLALTTAERSTLNLEPNDE